MARPFHYKKKLTGFTLIEVLIATLLFFVLMDGILSVTLKNYQFYNKISNKANISQELERLSLQIAKRVKYSSALHLILDNHGIYYVFNGNPGKIYFKEGGLWEETGKNVRKLPSSFLLDEANFIIEDGYLWGNLSIDKKYKYFEVKLP